MKYVQGMLAAAVAAWVFVGCSHQEPPIDGTKVDVAAQVKVLEGGDVDAKINALGELSKAGPRSVSALKVVIAQLKESDPILQRTAAFALEAMGPGAKEALPALEAAKNGATPDLMIALDRAARAIDPSLK